jgi:hypothetical protein
MLFLQHSKGELQMKLMKVFTRAAICFLTALASLFCFTSNVEAAGEGEYHFDTLASVVTSSNDTELARATAASPAVITTQQVADGIKIIDTISYDGLVAEEDGYYLLTTILYRINSDDTLTEIYTAEDARYTAPDYDPGVWTVVIADVNGLTAGTYVIYESAAFYINDGDIREDSGDAGHQDQTDHLQMIKVIESPVLTSKITASGSTASAETPASISWQIAEAGAAITDELYLEHADVASIVRIHAVLYDLSDHSEKAVKDMDVTAASWTADQAGVSTCTVDFSMVTLTPGRRYAAGITLYNAAEEAVVSHVDMNDVLEHIQVQPKEVPVTFHKKAYGHSEELIGASMKLMRGNQTLYEWVSSDTPQEYTLTPGTYRLIETAVPEGYLPADPITFQVNSDLSLSILQNDTWVQVSETSITMIDHRRPVPPDDYVVPNTSVR